MNVAARVVELISKKHHSASCESRLNLHKNCSMTMQNYNKYGAAGIPYIAEPTCEASCGVIL